MSPNQPEAFDPYHRWLGIPPKHQPADFYRLLAIERFEDDPEVIADAAERQVAHVRRYAIGPHSELSQRILNELATAKVCLLQPDKKAEYDQELREAMAAPESAARDIIVACGHCAKQFTAPESLAGKQVRCLNCQQPLSVPPLSSSPSGKRPAAKSAATADAPASSCPPEILVSCPRCRRRFLAQSWLVGKSVDCPSCGQTIRVTHEGSQISMSRACDIDPLSELPDLADFGEHSGTRPVSASRRTLSRQTYSARKPARGFDEDELPRWAWYAIGAAVGFVALVLLAILASSLWRGSSGAHVSTPADLDSDTGTEDSTSSEPKSETPPGKTSPRLHTSADGGYSILVPGPVRGRTQMDYLNQVTRHVDAVELPKDAGLFEVSYADQSLSADVRAKLANLGHAAAVALRASATETVEMDYKGNPALAIRFMSENPLSPTGRILLVAARRGDQHRLYMIVRSGPKGCAEGDEAEMIFQSFRVLP